tara:strand:+ start:218 stop:715 length:498 start_codon:yes stop_codon:yes gene_type:complete
MKVQETLDIIIEDYPNADSIAVDYFPLTREVYNADGGLTNLRALQTEVYYDIVDPSIQDLFDWAMGLVPQADISKHKVDQYWIAKYNKGDFTLSHSHYPCLHSFVYFVNSPKGSSPLVFTSSGQSVEAKKGRIVIFPGILEHHVPENQCDNRVIIAGNAIFTEHL